MSDKRRINLILTERVHDRLNWLQEVTEAESRTEVIRKALTVYEHLWRLKTQGVKTVIEDGDRRLELLLL